MTQTIIGLTGLIGSGKTTAAIYLIQNHGFERVRFADPIKEMMKTLGLSERSVDGDLKEIQNILLGGKTPRYAMQTLGTEWGRRMIDNDIWLRIWRHNVRGREKVVVDDVRFQNEVDAVRSMGGTIIRIERPTAGTTEATNHVSESGGLKHDAVIHNVGDRLALYAALNAMLEFGIKVDGDGIDTTMPRT